MKNEEYKPLTDMEWEQRTLCSDESCIGVIGPDGLCKECGLPYESEKLQEFSDEQSVSDSKTEEEKVVADEEEDNDETAADLEWEQRTLCRDESCIGVIGPDGRCKECGLPYGD